MHSSNQNTNSPKTKRSVPTQIYIKQNIHKRHTQNSKFFFVPSGLLLLKKHIRLGHAGIVDHSVDLSIPDLQKSIKEEWTEAIKNQKISYKCIIANTSVIWQHAAHTTDQFSSPNR